MIEPAEKPVKPKTQEKHRCSEQDFLDKLAKMDAEVDEAALKGTATIDRAALQLEELDKKAASASSTKLLVKRKSTEEVKKQDKAGAET